MNIVTDQRERVAEFVASRAPNCSRGFTSYEAIGVERNGTLVAGAIFHNWNPEAGVIEMSAAADDSRWLARPVIRALGAYTFDGLKCQLVVLRVSEHNIRVRNIADKFGFTAYEIPRLRGRDESEIVYTLSDDTWRTRPEVKHRG